MADWEEHLKNDASKGADKVNESLEESMRNFLKSESFQDSFRSNVAEMVSKAVGDIVSEKMETLKSLEQSYAGGSDSVGRVYLSAVESKGSEIVEDKELDYENNWLNLADDEREEAQELGFGNKHGTHAVLCVDTSGSMNEGDAWLHVKQFYSEYLNGMEELKEQDAHHANVALVTFGHETKVQQRLTEDLASLRGKLDDITPSGPSPLFGGLVMAAAAAQTSNLTNNLAVRPKIILVTDGRPTELSLQDGEDIADDTKLEQTKKTVFKEVEKLRREQIDLHCIYVDKNADRAFLRHLQSETIGELMSYRGGKKMALYTSRKTSSFNLPSDQLINVYHETNDDKYPKVGTRVKRVDNWRWGNQDNNKAGTIIGHAIRKPDDDQCWVHVEWDDDTKMKGNQNVYRYKLGDTMEGDVKDAKDDRVPPKGKVLGVGSRVKPGEGFLGESNAMEGVVIRFQGNQAEVKWNNGSRDNNSYGSAKPDIVPAMDPERTAPVGAANEKLCEERTATVDATNEEHYKERKATVDATNEEHYKERKATGDAKTEERYEERKATGDAKTEERYEERKATGDAKTEERYEERKATVDAKTEERYEERKATGDAKTEERYEERKATVDAKTEEHYEERKATVDAKTEEHYEERKATVDAKTEERYEESTATRGAANKIGVPKVNLSERRIADIAATIGQDWQILGTFLGIDNVVINRITEDNGTMLKRISSLLNLWRRTEKSPTLNVLVKAIAECSVHYNNDRLQEIIEETRKEMFGKMSSDITTCDICCERDRKTALIPCGHTFCNECAVRQVQHGDKNCPLCRKPIENTLHLFNQ